MLTALAPAKVNLHLCVTGARGDGFHNVDSLIAMLDFGDELELEPHSMGQDALVCDEPSLATEDNLVLRAVKAFRQWFPAAPFFRIRLQKKIPSGAGLGGGSSDAATALLLANRACGNPLDKQTLLALAASLGSDCPVFLNSRPTFVSGRGEVLESANGRLAAALSGRKVIVFKPPFAIATPWAYRCLSKHNRFSSVEKVTALRSAWQALTSDARVDSGLLYNDFEAAMCERHLALRVVLANLRQQLQAPVLMSGSGSACFVLEPNESEKSNLLETLTRAFGSTFFWVETCLLGNNTCSINGDPYHH
jgi:4-diphosphocytidyl-2-C-methyl-D-erythritol kinase